MARHGSPMALSPSPPPQMTKRAKRRRNVVEKLNDMISTFSKDQTGHYRAQLQAIQVDMTLILRADPYENMPLDDSSQAIEELVMALIGGEANIPGGRAAKEDFYAIAGRRYFEYCQEINGAQEKRDADLTLLKNKYDNANTELDRSYAYKMQVAQREHIELATTIRQRLINTVTKKRERLLREKEQLDIAESNSLLLHPGHYAINIPASPGGIHSNRKTRHTRHRAGGLPEIEDLVPERGRKRKLPGDEDTNDSPVTAYRALPQDISGGASPFQDQRAKVLRSQQEATAYSIDSIFTEKELAHATSAAQFATHHFFHQQPQANGRPPVAAQSNGHVPSTASNDGSAEAASALAAGIDRGATPPASQPEGTGMERQMSNYATRGATRANPLSFLSDAAMVVSINDPVVNPFLPVMIPVTKTDKGAPTPPSASNRDVAMDLAIMRGGSTEAIPSNYVARPSTVDGSAADGDVTVAEAREMFLEQACRDPVVSQPFRIPLTDLGPALIRDGVNRPAAIGFADPASIPNGIRNGTSNVASGYSALAQHSALGGVGMSRTTSYAGGSDIGDLGGVDMRRTRSRAQ